MKKEVITRRTFLKNSASAAIGGAIYMYNPKAIQSQTGEKTKVVLIRDRYAVDRMWRPNAETVSSMLDEAVMTLLDEKDATRAWNKIVKADDIVGIKSNVWSRLRTPAEMEDALVARVMNCGVSEDNISVDDRGVLSNPVFQKATALINIRPMRTHAWSAVGSLIKNYIMFAPRPRDYHDDSCADLAAVWELPIVKGKTRLNISVMLTPLFHGMGPHHFNPRYTWPYKGILVGFDPVAVDSVCVRIIQAKRDNFFKGAEPVKLPYKHIFLADTRHHLGTADPGKIDLIKLGWETDQLI